MDLVCPRPALRLIFGVRYSDLYQLVREGKKRIPSPFFKNTKILNALKNQRNTSNPWDHRRKALALAELRQARFAGKTKVQINHNTWIYVPKKIARSKSKLIAFLRQREERLQASQLWDAQEKAGRQRRRKAAIRERKQTQSIKLNTQ